MFCVKTAAVFVRRDYELLGGGVLKLHLKDFGKYSTEDVSYKTRDIDYQVQRETTR
jgi:hypothetical protein